jgi:nucleoside-diphosphate-sugar epimerase
MNTPHDYASFSDARCLVTGGGGFIGSHMVTRLAELGARVRVLDNFSTGYRHNLKHVADRIELVDGDVSDAEVAASAVGGCDYVFHLAAMASVPRSMREPELCHAWCATSTINLLAAAAQHSIRRMVLASTSAAYGNSTFTAKRESDLPQPLSPYAAAKLASEMYCAAFAQDMGVETVALRFFNVFGPRQDPNSEYSAVIPRFVAKILAGERPIVYGDGGQSRDFVYVGDVVQANLLAATVHGVSGQVFNVGRGTSTTLLSLLEMLRDILGEQIEPIYEPPRAGDVRDSLADMSKTRRQLGFEPQVTIRQGLEQSIEYYRGIVSKS